MSDSLYDRMQRVDSSNPYFSKDLEKARQANKFIGRGSIRSSTHLYMTAARDLANCGAYEATDVVFISAEGKREGRLEPDLTEIKLAIDAGADFITDTEFDRNRVYNVGERRVAEFLRKFGYEQKGYRWRKKKPRTVVTEEE